MKKCTIVIPHHNRHDHLYNLLNILDNEIFDIVVVSGGSFAENCNKGAKTATTECVIFLNDDTLPKNSDLIRIYEALDKYDIVSSTQITKEKAKYYGIGLEMVSNFITHRIQLRAGNSILPSAFCLGIKKKTWDILCGFNEEYITGNEDVDFGLRAIGKNLKMTILDLEIKHLESQSDGRFFLQKKNNDTFEKMYSQQYLKPIYKNPIDINEFNIKKLKIAITCSTMAVLSGSPIYNYTLAKELAIQGHDVDVYSGWGKYYKDLDKYGVRRLDTINARGDYDLLLISQKQSFALAKKISSKKIINIVHSEYDCETPVIDNKIDQYIAIRPSIKEHLIKHYGISDKNITVVYNGVDLAKFSKNKRKKHKEKYTKVVLPCTFDQLRLPFIEHYTKQASKDFRVLLIGQSFNNKFYKNEYVTIHKEVEDIENYITDADYIAGILLGRVNLEAMAMGIPSYIHNPANPEEFSLFDLSSKEFKKRHNIVNVAKDIIDVAYSTPIFDKIYEQNYWHDKDSKSGTGSNLLQTGTLREELPVLFDKYKIKSILDIPCGDFYWFKHVDLKGVDYIGADIVVDLINNLKEEYAPLKFVKLDICSSPLPKTDLILVRDCFVHLPYSHIKRAINNIKKSGAKYLLTTSFPNHRNKNIKLGKWRPINLIDAPFSFPKPIYTINENCTENNGNYNDKSMILFNINEL